MKVMGSIGSHPALELRLLRVRDKVIGSKQKNRESFDPINFLTNVFENNDVIVLASNTEEGLEEVMIRKKVILNIIGTNMSPYEVKNLMMMMMMKVKRMM